MRGKGDISYIIRHITNDSDRVEKFKKLGWKVLKIEAISYPQDVGGYEKWIDQINYTIVWSKINGDPIYPKK